MFPQFGAADTFSKASTIMFRIGTDAHLYDDPEDVNIAPLLDSKFDSEKCEALKRLLALIAQGFDVSNFFPQVVKNVASQSMEVKKLVYLYLLHYAEKRPNEALLSINSFQKDLGDPNPLVRAWALRTMAGIRLHVIAPLVLVAVNKCARDPSVYVRKCAANALPKLHDLRLEEHHCTIEEILRILLSDNSPGVVGAAAAAFTSICPNNYSLLSRNYRRLCEILPDVEEWGQIVLIGILLHYVVARHGLVKESIMSALQTRKSSQSEQDDVSDTTMGYDSELARLVSRCYIEGPDEYLSRSTNVDGAPFEISGEYFTSGRGDDVKVLLQSTSPLLWSNNSAAVLAAAGVHWIMAPKEDIKRIIKPLLFLLRSSNTSKYVVLCNVQVFAKAMPSLFAPHYEDFFITSSDSYQTKALKLDILCTIATDSSISSIFIEFQDYVRDPDRRFAADTVAAVGLCAERLPKMAATFLDWLLALTRQEFLTSDFESADGEAGVLIQAIVSLKQIIKQDPLTHEKVVMQLVRSLDSIRVPAARAIIIWMIGEYKNLGDIIPRMLKNVLKYLAWSFRSEALETKLQILNTTIKVLSDIKRDELNTYRKVGRYVLGLAQSDLNYDVRDRARFLKNLFSCNLVSQEVEEDMKDELSQVLSKHMFEMQSKLNSLEPVNYRFYLPGSLSQVVVHAAPGYEPLPKPCSIILDKSDQFPYMTNESNELGDDTASGSDTASELSNEESASEYSSGHSVSSSNGGSDGSVSASEGANADPLIQISNADDGYKTEIGNAQSAAGIEGLMSSTALESWLDDQPASSNRSSSQYSQDHKSFARISIKDIAERIKPKSYSLLDQANGNGLKVDYSFSCETSSISSLLTCVEVSFENCSTETISELVLLNEGTNKASDSAESASVSNDVPVLVPMEEIRSLGPGEIIKRILHIRFHHHLLPVKLVLVYNDQNLPVKLRPDIGYFVKPIAMNVEAFRVQESRLRGMFEYTRSCTFIDHVEELDKDKSDALAKDKFLILCDSLALKMLSNANLFLVSVDMPITADLDDASGLCLRFSCEIISSSVPCLITVTAEGKCYQPLNVSVKVNCEETVFGLNLLNRIINFLS